MVPKRLAVIAALVAAALLPGPDASSRPPEPGAGNRPVELYFELKLLLRGRWMFRRVALDQWAGGRLLMEESPAADGQVGLRLLRPLQDPWTFRWYPTKDEVKLGAAVSVREPRGDVYRTPAVTVEPLAREKYELWWEDDVVRETAPASPSWAAQANRFWAERHKSELGEKDPLHAEPVYAFHVLGDPRGRFAFRTYADGSVATDSIVDRMSEPWLKDGWSRWQAGLREEGYGFWGRERPSWEPRTYPALAEALRLLAWPGCPAEARGVERVDTDPGTETFFGQLGRVVATLVPRAAGRVDWSGSPVLALDVIRDAPRGPACMAKGETRLEGGRARLWRRTGLDGPRGRVAEDELQVFFRQDDGRLKLWIKIGHRPWTGPVD